jgi:hypothetical protein
MKHSEQIFTMKWQAPTEGIWLLRAVLHRNVPEQESSQHNFQQVRLRGQEFELSVAITTSHIDMEERHEILSLTIDFGIEGDG